MAQSQFLLSAMTLVVALHLLDKQPKKKQQQKSVFGNDQTLLTAAVHLGLHFPLETAPSN